MSEFNDPFAAAPDEAQTTPEPEAFETPPAEPEPPAPKKAPAKKAAPKAAEVSRPVAAPSEGKVVLTFKGGTGYDAPWIVIHATDMDDALDQTTGENSAKLAQVMDRVQKAGSHFAGLAPAKTSGHAPAQQRQAPPAAAQAAPNNETRQCAHGEMRYRSGVSKAGKPYKAFFCASGDRNNECPAQFLR